METDKTYPILVVCALIVRDGNVLLEKHEDGIWDLPGGKVEINETPRNAIRREIREELNIEIDPYSLLEEMYTSERDGGNWVLAGYRCNWVSGSLTLSDNLAWKPIASLSLHNTQGTDFCMIRDAMRGR